MAEGQWSDDVIIAPSDKIAPEVISVATWALRLLPNQWTEDCAPCIGKLENGRESWSESDEARKAVGDNPTALGCCQLFGSLFCSTFQVTTN